MNAMLGDLPTWNLSDLYSSPSGSDLDADLTAPTPRFIMRRTWPIPSAAASRRTSPRR